MNKPRIIEFQKGSLAVYENELGLRWEWLGLITDKNGITKPVKFEGYKSQHISNSVIGILEQVSAYILNKIGKGHEI